MNLRAKIVSNLHEKEVSVYLTSDRPLIIKLTVMTVEIFRDMFSQIPDISLVVVLIFLNRLDVQATGAVLP